MRTPVVVLAILMLGPPSTLLAQQREPAPAARVDEHATAGSDGMASGQVARHAAPRSLMGTAMAVLIESAERSARQAAKPAKAAEDTRTPAPSGPAKIDQAAPGQVVVQTTP